MVDIYKLINKPYNSKYNCLDLVLDFLKEFKGYESKDRGFKALSNVLVNDFEIVNHPQFGDIVGVFDNPFTTIPKHVCVFLEYPSILDTGILSYSYIGDLSNYYYSRKVFYRLKI